MKTCMSIRPDRSSAGSSFSMWFVVKTKMRSDPQHDHSPSVKLSRPESVIDRPDAAPASWSIAPSRVDRGFGAGGRAARLVRSTEQSMSSITMMDLDVVFISSFRSSALLLTSVSSRSYTSYPRKLAMAAIMLDLPVPGGPYRRYPRFQARPVRS
uniref:Uncharacterized protein n=1 Tax=Triticum urartu TaxID=4572 RepID=A0A8R7UG22_TRIUA